MLRYFVVHFLTEAQTERGLRMPDLVQELQLNCGNVEIFVDIYSGNRISKFDQQSLGEQLKALGVHFNFPAGRIRILVHDLGRGMDGTVASAEIFGKFCAYTSSIEHRSRVKGISGTIGACLKAIKVCLDERKQGTEDSKSHDPVMGKIGDPVPVDEILKALFPGKK